MTNLNKFHKIPTPSGSVEYVKFQYNNSSHRVEQVENIVDKWEDYCNDNWITFNSGGYGITPEDKVKNLLDNLATALLIHDDINNNTLDYKDINEIAKYEIELNSFFADEEQPEDLEMCVDMINNYVNDLSKGDGKIIQPELKADKVAERRKARTKLDKFNDIYGLEPKEYSEYIKDNRLPYMPKYWTEIKHNTLKTKGVIDKSKPYKVDWVNVRVDRRFKFNDKIFRISEKAEQYLYSGLSKRFDMYRDDFKMVKVLCFEQYGKYYFYDENIDDITEMVELEN